MADRKLGIIEISKLKKAPQLMMDNQHLTTVNCPFPELTDGSSMFQGCSKLTSFTSSDLGNLQNGECFLYGTKISQFTTDLPKLTNADGMFGDCNLLTTVRSNMPLLGSGGSDKTLVLPNSVTTFEGSLENVTSFTLSTNIQTFKGSLRSLTNGTQLFYDYTANSLRVFESDLSSVTSFGGKSFPSSIQTFNASLSSLQNGNNLFSGCNQMINLNVGSLSKLEQGDSMFHNCSGIGTWDLHMGALQNGTNMFMSCDGLTYFRSYMHSMTNGRGMFLYDSKLETAYVNLASLTDGEFMFGWCDSLKYFSVFENKDLTTISTEISNLKNGADMFYGCTALTSFYPALPSLNNGLRMFTYSGLASFNNNGQAMAELVNGKGMFKECASLGSVEITAPKLVDASEMFANTISLTNTSYDNVSSSIAIINNYGTLSNAAYMFSYSGIKSFSEENCQLSSVKNGSFMFYKCANLTSFTGKLNSLLSGYNMFCGCELDSTSLNYIKSYINDISSYVDWPENGGTPNFKGSETWEYDCWTNTPTATVTEGDGDSTTNITKAVIPDGHRGRIHVDFAESITENEKAIFKAELLAKGWQVTSCATIADEVDYSISVASTMIDASTGAAKVDEWKDKCNLYEAQITSITYNTTDGVGVMNGTDKFDRQ